MALQTAVEWLHEKTSELNMQLERKEISIGQFAVQYKETFEQAKQMEREQMEDAWGDGNKDTSIDSEHYYTKTYKQTK